MLSILAVDHQILWKSKVYASGGVRSEARASLRCFFDGDFPQIVRLNCVSSSEKIDEARRIFIRPQPYRKGWSQKMSVFAESLIRVLCFRVQMHCHCYFAPIRENKDSDESGRQNISFAF